MRYGAGKVNKMHQNLKNVSSNTSVDQDIVPQTYGFLQAGSSFLVVPGINVVTKLEHFTVLDRVPYIGSPQQLVTLVAKIHQDQLGSEKFQEINHLALMVYLLIDADFINLVVHCKVLVLLLALGSLCTFTVKYFFFLRLQDRPLKQRKRAERNYLVQTEECQLSAGIIYTVANCKLLKTFQHWEDSLMLNYSMHSLVPMSYGISL